jgi:hypothetical protein
MVSTLEAFFSGQRELFSGLYADTVEWEWQQYPILHIDLNTEKYDSAEALMIVLERTMRRWEKKYPPDMIEKTIAGRFESVIEAAYSKTGRQVVILVDEYDKPLLQAIGKPELQKEYRNTLKAFYGALKSCDRYIKFAFLTGVTKFGKVSVFSDLNNLIDLSLDHRYATICGISEDELHQYFDEGVARLAEENEMTKDEVKAEFDAMCTAIANDFTKNLTTTKE